MNTSGVVICPCCGQSVYIDYDDEDGFSLNSYNYRKILEEKINEAKMRNEILEKLCGSKRDTMDYLLNNLKQCCCGEKSDGRKKN